MRSWAAGAAVFLLTFLIFSLGTGPGLGIGYLDPVGRIEAQDEAVYSHIAIRMAERGGWLTPVFMDRFFLYKPPLLYWMSGLSAKIFGITPFALRLPSLLAAAGVCLIVFCWTKRWTGVVLLAASPLFFTLAARSLTDAPLCFLITLAMGLLDRDRRLERWTTTAGIGAASGCAILTKSTAGLVPLIILLLVWIVAKERAPFWKLAAVGAVAVAIAAPWFVYQSAAHPRWFWGEFVEVELLAYGSSAAPQTTQEGTAAFYASRWIWAAPVLVAAWLAAMAACWRRWRDWRVPLVWVGVMTLAIASYHYRNITYLLPALPAMALVAGTRFPALAAVAVGWALLAPQSEPRETVAVARLLRQRCQSGRANEFIIVDTPDQFHATVLPFRKVRYAFPGDGQPPKGFSLDFRKMGIVVTVDEFLDIEKHRARFSAEMRAWGLPGEDALASVIAFSKPEDLDRLRKARPDADFLVKGELVEAAGAPRATPSRSCAM